MKLLIITAIKEFEKDVLKILKKGEVKQQESMSHIHLASLNIEKSN